MELTATHASEDLEGGVTIRLEPSGFHVIELQPD